MSAKSKRLIAILGGRHCLVRVTFITCLFILSTRLVTVQPVLLFRALHFPTRGQIGRFSWLALVTV